MTDEEKLEAIYKRVNEIWQGLYGIPETEEKGLCGELEKLIQDLNRLSSNFRLLVGILIGSGVLTGSVLGVIQILG